MDSIAPFGRCARTECERPLPKPKKRGQKRIYCSLICRQIVSLIRRAAVRRGA